MLHEHLPRLESPEQTSCLGPVRNPRPFPGPLCQCGISSFPAWMFGDPHITTLDGANYTFNGLGDFLLVRAQDRNSSFQLQGRTAQTLSARATNFIAFAAEYSSSSLDPITVSLQLAIESQEEKEKEEGQGAEVREDASCWHSSSRVNPGDIGLGSWLHQL